MELFKIFRIVHADLDIMPQGPLEDDGVGGEIDSLDRCHGFDDVETTSGGFRALGSLCQAFQNFEWRFLLRLSWRAKLPGNQSSEFFVMAATAVDRNCPCKSL